MTKVLRFGYWPSYNIPFFPVIQQVSGCTKILKLYIVPFLTHTSGNDLVQRDPHSAYDFAPRANVFRRNNSLVEDLASFQSLLRYNNWQHDPLAMSTRWEKKKPVVLPSKFGPQITPGTKSLPEETCHLPTQVALVLMILKLFPTQITRICSSMPKYV